MATASHCPQCGGPLVPGALGNRCPRCLMDLGLSDVEEADRPASAAGIRQFGDYGLLEEIGRGGMGVVYRARQISLNRIVAVKMLVARPFAVPELEERLHLEAEAAAGLNHPHIVTIYDFGECDDQFYFSMEYIEGRSLAQLTRHHSLAPKQAAQYLKTVAEAVQHAHEHGILHRDLKPSNILIDLHDQVKITDFGLAKRLGTDSELTLTGALVGSPNYLSPEQAAGQHRALTARSDVYSLGAVLYQLLTARPPLVGKSLQETLVQIREKEAPSLRLLNPHIPRDLETICLKCLRKEPEQRYASAQELAEDLGRFLEGKPILARPVSAAGRAWRWCRRNPALACALTAVAASLVGVIVVTSLLAAEARRQAANAERQARDYREFSDFMLDKVLPLVDPFEVGGETPTREKFLDATSLRLEGLFAGQPLVEARLRTRLGETYRKYGKFESARRQLEQALEPQRRQSQVDPELLVRTLTSLGWVYGEGSPITSAEALFREAIEIGEKQLGSDHPLTLEAWLGLGSLDVELGRYSEAEAVSTALLASYARLPGFVKSSLWAKGVLARALGEKGQLDRAEGLLRQRLRTALVHLGTNDPGTLNTHWMLGRVLGLQPEESKHDEAEGLLRSGLERQAQVLGEQQQWFLMSQHELGALLRRKGDLPEAEKLLTDCWSFRVRQYGETNLWTIESTVELGWLRADQGKLKEAQSLFQRALALAIVEVGTEHPIALNARHGLGVAAAKGEHHDEAEFLLLAAVEGRLRVHGPTYPGTVTAINDLIVVYERWDKPEEAEKWRKELERVISLGETR